MKTIVLAFTLGFTVASLSAGELAVRGNSLLLHQAGGTERVIGNDPAGIEHAQLSPDGTRVAWNRPFRSGEPHSSIVIARLDGTILRTIPITDEAGINAVLQLGWLDDRRVWVEGHVTPSSGIYYAWDASSGKQLDERWGSWFAPSPNGKHVAQVEHVPHGARMRPHLLIDGEIAYPRGAVAGALSQLTWSPDGNALAFVEAAGERASVVVIGAGGRLRERLTPTEPVTDLRWIDGNHLRIGKDATHDLTLSAR